MKKIINRLRVYLQRVRHIYQVAIGIDKGTQLLLQMAFVQGFRATGRPLDFDAVEFRSYSQNGEDGILLYIFSLIGSHNKVCVEVCAGNGVQCNTANLIVNHGWTGLMVDGSARNVSKARKFYAAHPDTSAFPPTIACEWITSENINDVLRAHKVEGEIDLLSLDIDGNDYWILQALNVVRPRVIVAEVQIILGPDVCLSIPYDPTFTADFVDGCGIYCGASIAAFVKLARTKGYRLVGAQRYGFNAFFIRDDVGMEIFPEVDAAVCFRHPFAAWARDRFYPLIKDRPWVPV